VTDTNEYYYFDTSVLKAFKVIAIPQTEAVRMKVSDADRDPRAYYFVPAELLGRTEAEAIRLAKGYIQGAQDANHLQRDELQRDDDELCRLLAVCDEYDQNRSPPLCSVCGEPQFMTPSGSVCKNGHGGADSA
jgi:hypothetical protein